MCGHRLRLQRLVRPADRHLGGNGPDQVLPQRKLHCLPGALVRKADDRGRIGGGGGLAAAFLRSSRDRLRLRRRGSLHKSCAGKTVGSARQSTAQHQQNGAQQQKGSFHDGPPPGTQASGTEYARQHANRREMRRGKQVFLRFAVRSAQFALEFTSQKRYYKRMSIKV